MKTSALEDKKMDLIEEKEKAKMNGYKQTAKLEKEKVKSEKCSEGKGGSSKVGGNFRCKIGKTCLEKCISKRGTRQIKGVFSWHNQGIGRRRTRR